MSPAGLVGMLLVLSPAQTPPTQRPQSDSCIACHEALPDARLSAPAKDFAQDVHALKGFGCVACHGGDGSLPDLESMDRSRGFLGKPRRQQVPQLCGRCHSDAQFMKQYNPALRVDQEAEYATSIHGRRLAQLDDPRVAICSSCHKVHAIRPPSDPQSSVHALNVARTCGACHANAETMATYGIPTDQLDKYRTSVHWEALSGRQDRSAPTCNDCHGNHGAAPPGIAWVGNTCGQCHSVMASNFAKSKHAEIFPLLGIPGCVACHNNHDIKATSDEMLGLGPGAVCTQCHEAGTPQGDQAAGMRLLIDSLRIELDSSGAILRRAEQAGVEVSQAQLDLQGAHAALVSSRTAMHTFDLATLAADVAGGRKITSEAFDRGRRALAELRFRRTGLAIFALVILGLIAALILRIREIEGPGMKYVMFTMEMKARTPPTPPQTPKDDSHGTNR